MSETIINKRCSKCKIDKPLSEFYKDFRNPTGYQSWCKDCQKAYRLTEKGRMVGLRYAASEKGCVSRHRYEKTNKGKLKQKRYEQSPKGRKNRCAASRRHRQKYPYQEPAKWAVKYAIETGKIPLPPECSCLICGQKARDYHHKSYAREHWLDVIPLCRQCHINIHKNHGSVPELSK